MRRMVLAVTMAAVGLPILSVASEPNWIVLVSNDSFVEFLDVNSLAIRAGHLTASVMTNYTVPQLGADNKPFQSVRALGIYDCSAERSGAVDLTLYAEKSGRGEVVISESIKPAAVRLNHSVPGTAGQKEIQAVCSTWARSQTAGLVR